MTTVKKHKVQYYDASIQMILIGTVLALGNRLQGTYSTVLYLVYTVTITVLYPSLQSSGAARALTYFRYFALLWVSIGYFRISILEGIIKYVEPLTVLDSSPNTRAGESFYNPKLRNLALICH
jgi:hypothetical protein